MELYDSPWREISLDAHIVSAPVEGLDLEVNELSYGSYSIIYKVIVDGRKCVAKKLHSSQLDESGDYFLNREIEFNVSCFKNECRILSRLNHLNVVSFVGIHYGIDKNDVSLIMERLYSDLADFLLDYPDTRLSDRIHILHDVSKGLEFLHCLIPPLIHRDLTTQNILLSEDLTAKIGDLGSSRFANVEEPISVEIKPGHQLFMPPECGVSNPAYTTKLDVFLFGNLIIQTITGSKPAVQTIPSTDPELAQYISEGKVELMRRSAAVHLEMGITHCLYPLVVHCLRDNPLQRPGMIKVKLLLLNLCSNYPRQVRKYASNSFS